jgi:hypothetical protein
MRLLLHWICGKWPETEVTRRPRFDRDRMKSGHNSDIAEVKGDKAALLRRINPPAKNRRAGRHKP